MVITLSGPAASGKGTLARILAKELALPHYDFGLIFRIIALLEKSYNIDCVLKFIEHSLLTMSAGQAIFCGVGFNHILRLEEIGLIAAQLASRDYEMIESTAKLMVRHDDFVGDGRTCNQMYPTADYKFYVTAEEKERLQRRQKDGGKVSVFSEREVLDHDRLTSTPDSLFINTDGKSQEESLQDLLLYIK